MTISARKHLNSSLDTTKDVFLHTLFSSLVNTVLKLRRLSHPIS